MALDEYLDKLAAEGYRQQLADEENVPRSLPFFATSLAVLVAILGAIKDWIPKLDGSVLHSVIWGLLALLAFCLALIIYFLREAVRRRDYKYIMDELALAKYVSALRDYYADAPDRDLAEAAILADVESELGRQYRAAAVNNRTINFDRARARASAFEVLIFALLLAFAVIATTLWAHQ